MRKLLILLCTLTIIFTFVGCNNSSKKDDENSVPETNSNDYSSFLEFPFSGEAVELPDVELEY